MSMTLKTIEGFPSYQVSSDGRVFSTMKWNDGNFRELKLETVQGYKYANLMTPGGTKKKISVHRLVAKAFLPKPENPYWIVRHLDGSRDNNDVSNLIWGTHAENSQDRNRHGTMIRGSDQHLALLTESQVSEIKRLLKENKRNKGEQGKAYKHLLTQEEIGKMFNVSRECISGIAHGRNWKHVN